VPEVSVPTVPAVVHAPTSPPAAGQTPATGAAVQASVAAPNANNQTLPNQKEGSTVSVNLMPWLPESTANTLIAQSNSARSLVVTSSPVVASDVLVNIRASTMRQKVGFQCQGVDSDLVAMSSRFVKDSAGLPRQRFGLAGTTDAPVMRFEVGMTDVISVPPRCEHYSMPNSENGFLSGDTVWHVARLWTDDWTGTSDEQVVMQWKNHGPKEVDQNPFFSLVIKGGQAVIQVRSNDIPGAARSLNTIYVAPPFAWKARQWNSVIVQSKVSSSANGGGFVRVWVNGVSVFDRAMPVGYRLASGGYNYSKWGVYKWLNGNPWDPKYPIRSVMFERVLLIRDNAKKYDLKTISDYSFN